MLQSVKLSVQEASDGLPSLGGLDGLSGPLSSRVYTVLREAILTLSVQPGQILRKGDICEQLGVSRSPVSEAIARLSSEGLVDVVPQAGTFVARFSMAEIREGAFLREAIEVAAADQVARTISDEQIVELQRNLTLQEALVQAGDTRGFYTLDSAMHALMLSFTGFRRVAYVAETAWLHVDRARRLVLPVPGRVAETLDEHRRIVAALSHRNPEEARRATRDHLRQLLTFLEPLEQTHPELFHPPR